MRNLSLVGDLLDDERGNHTAPLEAGAASVSSGDSAMASRAAASLSSPSLSSLGGLSESASRLRSPSLAAAIQAPSMPPGHSGDTAMKGDGAFTGTDDDAGRVLRPDGEEAVVGVRLSPNFPEWGEELEEDAGDGQDDEESSEARYRDTAIRLGAAGKRGMAKVHTPIANTGWLGRLLHSGNGISSIAARLHFLYHGCSFKDIRDLVLVKREVASQLSADAVCELLTHTLWGKKHHHDACIKFASNASASVGGERKARGIRRSNRGRQVYTDIFTAHRQHTTLKELGLTPSPEVAAAIQSAMAPLPRPSRRKAATGSPGILDSGEPVARVDSTALLMQASRGPKALRESLPCAKKGAEPVQLRQHEYKSRVGALFAVDKRFKQAGKTLSYFQPAVERAVVLGQVSRADLWKLLTTPENLKTMPEKFKAELDSPDAAVRAAAQEEMHKLATTMICNVRRALRDRQVAVPNKRAPRQPAATRPRLSAIPGLEASVAPATRGAIPVAGTTATCCGNMPGRPRKRALASTESSGGQRSIESMCKPKRRACGSTD